MFLLLTKRITVALFSTFHKRLISTMAPIDGFPHAMAEMFAQITTSGVVTLADRHTIRAAVLQDSLSEEERQVLDRLLYAVRKGRVRVLDSSSALAS